MMMLQQAYGQVMAPVAAPVQTQLQPVPVVVVQTVETPIVKQSLPYFGYGGEKTVELLVFPAAHPIQFFNKVTFPARHPLVFVKNYGTATAPYLQGINAINATKQLLTP